MLKKRGNETDQKYGERDIIDNNMKWMDVSKKNVGDQILWKL